jgi:hypothetical protein
VTVEILEIEKCLRYCSIIVIALGIVILKVFYIESFLLRVGLVGKWTI